MCREWKAVRADGLDLRSQLRHRAKGDGGIRLSPLRGNLLEWHFSFTGPENSTYQEGVYHGRILLSQQYPHKAPRIQLLTPNGRFQLKTDICLSASVCHTCLCAIEQRIICNHVEVLWPPTCCCRRTIKKLGTPRGTCGLS